MITTFRAFHDLTSAAVWFFGAGIAMSLVGALNLLNGMYGHAARGVRLTAIVTNLATVVYASLAGLASRASVAELVVIVGLVASTTALSLLRATAGTPPGGST
ncbi:MAG: hypothetical protein HY700_18035 [Gemmatimonadetes bacterium]|nr:hypothetical protein [Gemmatimonadota bacterium]